MKKIIFFAALSAFSYSAFAAVTTPAAPSASTDQAQIQPKDQDMDSMQMQDNSMQMQDNNTQMQNSTAPDQSNGDTMNMQDNNQNTDMNSDMNNSSDE